MKQNFVSTTEAAKILGISRIAVFKRIKTGQLKAEMVGKRYLIETNQLGVTYRALTAGDKKRIKEAVAKVIRQYGEVIKKLGKE